VTLEVVLHSYDYKL